MDVYAHAGKCRSQQYIYLRGGGVNPAPRQFKSALFTAVKIQFSQDKMVIFCAMVTT